MARQKEVPSTDLSKHRLFFRRMQIVIVLFLFLAMLLYLIQRNISYERHTNVVNLLDKKEILQLENRNQGEAGKKSGQPSCLLLWEDEPQCVQFRDMMEGVLSQMKISFECQETEDLRGNGFAQYDSIVFAIDDVTVLGDRILDLMDWVENGGRLMFAFVPSKTVFFDMIAERIGIAGIGSQNVVIKALHFSRPFMLGGELQDYGIIDAYDSALEISLDEESEVYLEQSGENGTPLIWRRPVGKGTVVVCNLGYVGKVYRGIYGSAYSLLGDGLVYPVINASTFYIDDFPAPVPGGDDKHINEDYHMTVADFMMQIWWPDVQEMAEKHDVRYTGMVIEQYSDETEKDFVENDDLNRFNYFGRSLLGMGGEIGFHGYNHMPLVLKDFDYRGDFDEYRAWASLDSMQAGLEELNRFCKKLFPREKFQVYVPPSNILSEEGRRLLAEKFPQIRAIASSYFEGGVEYDQEFEVARDGVVETPRVISGYIINDFVKLAALSELTFHYVNTHFQHPDDVLDEDRGADLGWAELSRRLGKYMDWLYEAAPDIRNLTGTELAAAVQRYDALGVRQSFSKNRLQIRLDGFVDEAWLMVRLNGHLPGTVEGGKLEKLQEGLYLLEAQGDEVTIALR